VAQGGFRVLPRLAKKICSPEQHPKAALGTAPERLFGEWRWRGKAGHQPSPISRTAHPGGQVAKSGLIRPQEVAIVGLRNELLALPKVCGQRSTVDGWLQ